MHLIMNESSTRSATTDQDALPLKLIAYSIYKSSVHFVGFASRTFVLSPSSPSRSRMM